MGKATDFCEKTRKMPKKARAELTGEIGRVLKPGGRVLVIDFGGNAPTRKGFLDHIHRRHGHVDFKEIIAQIRAAGLNVAECGEVGMRDLQFVIGTAPSTA